MRKTLKEFKEFISKGNVIDMAVGVIVGGAFTAIINSLVADVFTPIVNMLIGAFSGLASGAGVVISQYYGAKRFAEVEKTVHTATAMTLIIIPVIYDIFFKRQPLEVDLGSENLDDVPDDAAEFIAQTKAAELAAAEEASEDPQ